MKMLFAQQFLALLCSHNQNLKIKTSPIFPFISLSVVVFSTIKFYGVPAGHSVHRDSPEKEVSTRCCEPSHAITSALSWLSVPLYLACTLPPACKTTGWHHNSCMFCSFVRLQRISQSSWIFFLPLILCEMETPLQHKTPRTHFVQATCEDRGAKTKMERVISFFFLGVGGQQCRVAMRRTAFTSNMDLEHPLPIASQNAGPLQSPAITASVIVWEPGLCSGSPEF